MNKISAPHPSGPLERYTQILEAIAASRNGLTGRDLSTMLMLPKTTVNRLLNGLAASELVKRTGRSGQYQIGRRLRRILESDTDWIISVSKRRLKALAKETAETCFIVRLFGTEIRSVIMESPYASVGVYVIPGHVLPPHATATGKLITAYQDAGLRKRILQAGLKRLTERTMVDREALEAEFETIRRKGYAVEDGEHVEGLYTIALPIPLSSDSPPIYALGLTGPAVRVGRSALSDLLEELRIAADDIGRSFLPTHDQL